MPSVSEGVAFYPPIYKIFTQIETARFQNCNPIWAVLFIIKKNIRKKSMKRFGAIIKVFAILKVSVCKGFGASQSAKIGCSR